MEKYTLNFEIPLVIWVKNHIVPLKKIESIASKEDVDFVGQHDWIAAWSNREYDKEYNGFNSQDVTMETVWKNGSYWITLTSNKPFYTKVSRNGKDCTLKEAIIIWLKGCISDGIGENEIGQVTYNYEDYDVWMDELIEIKNKVKKGKKNLLSAFGDRYRVNEYNGSYILYDKEGHARRETMLFVGQFYLTDKKDGYIFNDKVYDTTEELIDAMKAWGETLPFDVELYNPSYKPSYRIECAIQDYFKSMGFETEYNWRNTTFILRDAYGKDICSFVFNIDEDTAKGDIVLYITDGSWVQSEFTDLESAVGAVNTMIAPYCVLLQSKFTQVFSKLTKARINSLSTVQFDWSKLQSSKTNSIDSTIEMLENEIKLLKELKS